MRRFSFCAHAARRSLCVVACGRVGSLTAWFIFSAATMLSGGFLVMIHAQGKMIKQMSY